MNWQCWNYGLGRGWGMLHFGGPILWLFLLGGLLLLAVLGIRWLVQRKHILTTSSANVQLASEPLEIAKQRLARGEITKEEFSEIRELLST